MNEQVAFTLKGRNPDVLSCIANLSNDEVFTPPEFANRMEAEGRASIEDLVRAAIALRCDEGIAALFPEMAASSMDELLAQQRKASRPLRQRAGRARS